MQPRVYPIIGMSPGNSHFTEEIVLKTIQQTVEKFGETGILIPDIPAIATYVALGYTETRARRDKAIPKGNALRNKVNRAKELLGHGENVRIFDWKSEIEPNEEYIGFYTGMRSLYNTNPQFYEAVNLASKSVLENTEKAIENIDTSSKIAAHYLLSEFAFLEFIADDLGRTVTYIYHKPWKVYEDYIAGEFDGKPKTYLQFLVTK